MTEPALFRWLADTSIVVAAASKRNDKVAALAAVLRQVAAAEPASVGAATAFLSGTTLSGRLGVGYAALRDVSAVAAEVASLRIADVDAALDDLAAMSGDGVMQRRADALNALFGAATKPERRLLRSLISGELRQGALAGVVTTAVAAAAGVSVGAVQRAAMFLGSLPDAAQLALTQGSPALDAVVLQPGVAVQPMLASPADSVAAAVEQMGPEVLVQWKFDGARLQAHRVDGVVSLYTRNLNQVSQRLASVVAAVAALDGGDLVLDGEVMGVDGYGNPRPFQDTMGDFAAETDRGGLAPFWFDVLAVDGVSLVDDPLSSRLERLSELVPKSQLVPGEIVGDAAAVDAVFQSAVAAGHEGVVVKALSSTYEAGRRGKSWRKLKPVYTFDLVVLAVEWGHGRRTGKLSNLHLGARDDNTDAFVMVGKTFKGLTDELLAWQTQRFLELETHRDGHVVYVRPEQVVEIALDGIQRSSRYPGGVALRFARVKRYRHDKPASQANTLSALASLRNLR